MKQLWLMCALVLSITISSCTTPAPLAQPKPFDVQLQDAVTGSGVQAGLQLLAREMNRDQEVSAYSLTHKIGHAAYDKLGLNALQSADDLCGSGFFHGVITLPKYLPRLKIFAPITMAGASMALGTALCLPTTITCQNLLLSVTN